MELAVVLFCSILSDVHNFILSSDFSGLISLERSCCSWVRLWQQVVTIAHAHGHIAAVVNAVDRNVDRESKRIRKPIIVETRKMLTTEIKNQVHELERSGVRIAGHVATLARTHLSLLESELTGNYKQIRESFILSLITSSVGIAALVMLATASSELMLEYWPAQFSRGWSLMLAGGVLFLITLLGGVLVARRQQVYSLYPKKSLTSMKETAECLLNKH